MKNGPAGSSTAHEWLNSLGRMTDTTDNQTPTDTQTTTGDQSTDLPAAPGGNADNRETIENMEAPELRNAVIELLTIIDDSDDLDVVITIADDGTVVVAAA